MAEFCPVPLKERNATVEQMLKDVARAQTAFGGTAKPFFDRLEAKIRKWQASPETRPGQRVCLPLQIDAVKDLNRLMELYKGTEFQQVKREFAMAFNSAESKKAQFKNEADSYVDMMCYKFVARKVEVKDHPPKALPSMGGRRMLA